jgi:DNA-binding transcriptional MocR family regulator
LTRGASQSLSEQLAGQWAQAMALRVLAPGARLPSVREAARRHGVSPSTVVAAYDRLQAQGLVEARPQRGFFVRARPSAASQRPAPPPAVRTQAAPVDATALMRGMLGDQARAGSPGMGTLPEDWLDEAMLRRALRRACGDVSSRQWLGYGDAAGDAGLREALSHHLGDWGLAVPPGQLMTTLGALHGLDVVSRALLQPGDAVLVDEPGWAVEFARLQRLGMRVLPVPRGPEGPDLAVMAQLAREHQPRLYVTVSVLHNPTGACISAPSAHRVLQLAEAHDFLVVEDDSYGWLAPPHALRLAALDGLQRTLLVSGFSKILTPQWRVGFVAAPARLIERLLNSKLLGCLTSPAPLEHAVGWCLSQGLVRRHAERVVARLAAARHRTQTLAEQAGCRFATPAQGLFGWVDTGTDTDQLALQMHEQGWLLAPGSLFHAARRPSSMMRINFASGQDARFWRLFAGMRAGS